MAGGQPGADTFKGVFSLTEDLIAMGDKENPLKVPGVKGRQKGLANPGGGHNQALVQPFPAEVFEGIEGFHLGPVGWGKAIRGGGVAEIESTIKAA